MSAFSNWVKVVDFDDTDEEAVFRAEARGWLERHAVRRAQREADVVPLLEERGSPTESEAWVQSCRDWQRTKYKGGFAAIRWPKQWGGRDGSLMEEIIFAEEESRFDVSTGAFSITLGMVAPTILAHGTDDQRAHLPRILSGDEIWCQLFSEPSAGSDLASLRTRAVRDGDHWRIDGQKVWTSGAHYADWGYLLARSDPTVPKHAGLTAFMMPMDSPGVAVRPLRQMTGGANFNEVFLDGVRIPDFDRLGAPGSGWRVALTTLMNERFSVAGKDIGDHNFRAAVRIARQRGFSDDPIVRQRLTQLYIDLEILRFTNYRARTAISRGEMPGPEGSTPKLGFVKLMQTMSDVIVQLSGPEGLLDTPASRFLLGAPGVRLGGGTDEIMRNILGERVLGLPAEPRPDGDRPFAQMPS